MGTYTANFLTRDDRGRYERKYICIPATDAREVESYVRHGRRCGKWSLEGDLKITGPHATDACDTHIVTIN